MSLTSNNISDRADSGVPLRDGSLETANNKALKQNRSRASRIVIQLGGLFCLLVRDAALYRE